MRDGPTMLDHIGDTPLLRLDHITDGLDAEIYVKPPTEHYAI